eukprot:gene871-2562_t
MSWAAPLGLGVLSSCGLWAFVITASAAVATVFPCVFVGVTASTSENADQGTTFLQLKLVLAS